MHLINLWRQLTARMKVAFALATAVATIGLVCELVFWPKLSGLAAFCGAIAVLGFCLTMNMSAANRHMSAVNHFDELTSSIRKETSDLYLRVEASLGVISALRHGDTPLPSFGGWAIEPDLARFLVQSVYSARPRVVIELGSGSSTIVIAHCLRNLGAGMVTSFDHDPRFAEQTREQIRLHGLELWARVIDAPLAPLELEGKNWLWYDVARMQELSAIDLLFIDGPPKSTGPMVRYPAMPIFHTKLAPDCTIVLDDAKRPDETKIVEDWTLSYPEFTAIPGGLVRGWVSLHRTCTPATQVSRESSRITPVGTA